MDINADVKSGTQGSTAKKNNVVFQIPARTVEHAVLSKIDSLAYVIQASEERHVRCKICVPPIHASMKELALTWTTILSSASVREAGKDKTVKRETCAFLIRARMKDIVKHMDLHFNATVPWATMEYIVKLRILAAPILAIMVAIVSLKATMTSNVSAVVVSPGQSAKEQILVILTRAQMVEHVKQHLIASAVSALLEELGRFAKRVTLACRILATMKDHVLPLLVVNTTASVCKHLLGQCAQFQIPAYQGHV